ncbi:MAG: ABC transporter ATP-binding protein [Planctomycetota bacterium]
MSKAYRLLQQRPFLAREIVRRVLQRASEVQQYWALREVSFEVEKGTSVGLIGANGSGKSTLLSLIARTSYPTGGDLEVRGRVGPLLELGAGFHPDLTGFENVLLNASLLGLSREETFSRLDSILDYSGIDEFIHSPIQTYSVGMRARLGFAVIAHIDPDILLVDEVLSVGDAGFQAKCATTMRQFKDDGKTMLLVSHDMATIQDMCEQAIWLEEGEIRARGSSDEVVASYLESLETRTRRE